MNNLYLKRWEEYTPLLFSKKEYKKKKLIKVIDNCHYQNSQLVDQFKMDYLFNLDNITSNEGFGKRTILGQGVIVRNDRLVGIVVYKKTAPKNLTIPELRKNTFIALNKSFFNGRPQELSRLKKSMNTYGLSSRTQIILVEESLDEVFNSHPLKNTIADYSQEVQKSLSSEFLKSIIIPEGEKIVVEVKEEVKLTVEHFSVGDDIVILERPFMWSSYFTNNNPLESDIMYPFFTTITQISEDEESIEAGGYGWSLANLINNKFIDHTSSITEVEFEVDTDSETLSNLSERVDSVLEEAGSVLEVHEYEEETNNN